MFGRIHLWSHLDLDFCLLGVLKLQILFHIWWSDYSNHLFSLDLVLVGCMWKNLSIFSRLSNMLAYNCSQYSPSLYFCSISSYLSSFTSYFIWVFSLFFLENLAWGLSILSPVCYCSFNLYCLISSVILFLLFFGGGELHLWPMKVPGPGVESELQLLAYTTTTATQDLSHVCDLYHSSQQCWIPHPLSKARDQTSILKNTSQIHFHCTTTGTPSSVIFIISFLLLSLGLVCISYWMCTMGFSGFNFLKISIKSNCSITSLSISIALLIFCLKGMSVDVSGVLMSPTIIALSNSPFVSVWIYVFRCSCIRFMC